MLAAAEVAVEAWGRFATTSDLKALDRHFDPAGPQYRQLAAEAAERAADRSHYRLTLIDAEARPAAEG